MLVLRGGCLRRAFRRGCYVALRGVRAGALRRLVQAFHIMDLFHASRNERAPRCHRGLRVPFFLARFGEPLANTGGRRIANEQN